MEKLVGSFPRRRMSVLAQKVLLPDTEQRVRILMAMSYLISSAFFRINLKKKTILAGVCACK